VWPVLRLEDLLTSLSNLTAEFGQTDEPLMGVAVNLACAAVGVGAYLTVGQGGGWLGAVGALGGVGLAAISIGAIVAWVIGL